MRLRSIFGTVYSGTIMPHVGRLRICGREYAAAPGARYGGMRHAKLARQAFTDQLLHGFKRLTGINDAVAAGVPARHLEVGLAHAFEEVDLFLLEAIQRPALAGACEPEFHGQVQLMAV